MSSNQLPFERGTTYGDGQLTPTDAMAERLKGDVYEVTDTLHDTGLPVFLRVVQNDKATAKTVGRPGIVFPFTTSATSFGKRLSDTYSGDGEFGKPLDDFYTAKEVTSIPAYDLMYVVEGGPCDLMADAANTVTSAAIGAVVSVSGSGLVDAAPSAGDYIVGAIMENADVASSTSFLCLVKSGIIDQV